MSGARFAALDEAALRQALVHCAVALERAGLNRGTTGNASARLAGGLLITPSGVPADELSAVAMVLLDASGAVIGPGRPSSEWRLHQDILAARPLVQAVVHTHAPFATSLACLGLDLPAFHYMVAVAGGVDVRCAPYELFGTQALSNVALQALQGRKACLLANHGMVTLGADLDEALAISVEIESLCGMYWRALQLGQPSILNDAQMAAVLERFKDYGCAAQPTQAP